ncbi:eukaryotic membrane protein family-domain-containing protein [Podospora australis]|uniref:Eukaryotic membrane protein family-domain-containing protein n=1 Tax=Podospora australis TaxID=1536484 RepID=A0AAN6WTJ6_9PEZI|nr:eukaryotic membrane protein family-domain-containing protein [Podospora australis]
MESAIGSGREDGPLSLPPTGASTTSRSASRRTSGAGNLPSPSPSPMLRPTDPRPPVTSEPRVPLDQTPSSPIKGVPTPDPSSDSLSDADPSSDSTSSGLGAPEPAAGPAKETELGLTTTRSRSNTKTSNHDGVRRLSASKMQELTAAPESLPVAAMTERKLADQPLTTTIAETIARTPIDVLPEAFPRLSVVDQIQQIRLDQTADARADATQTQTDSAHTRRDGDDIQKEGGKPRHSFQGRPSLASRTVSTPPMSRRTQSTSSRRNSHSLNPPLRPLPLPLDSDARAAAPKRNDNAADEIPASPVPPTIPLPPMSVPTLLELELAGQRPSPLYIHHSYTADIPYESSAVKFERLKNFVVLPWYLESAVLFGALACLDAWLWTFTILPMRFCISLGVLVQWWGHVIKKEAQWLVGFVWYGLGRMWRRGRRGRSRSAAGQRGDRTDESRSRSRMREPTSGESGAHTSGAAAAPAMDATARRRGDSRTHATIAPSKKPSWRPTGRFRHRRTKSSPSNLTSFNKADLLQGAIIICSSIILMNLDASRVYHFIRVQSAIKLYALHNLFEVGDRLLSALGQDVLECLFSAETLSRNSSGRSKVMLPLGMFLGALVYNTLHSIVLFYQVLALNVAVNSYSNALLMLLLSNQFVEIKSTVFKRFEKENTFQLTCADIVERFQLWIMFIIIAMRNIVEIGGFSVPGAGNEDAGPSSFPLHTSSILPNSFTIIPSWLWSGEVLSPFIVVIGSEMIVDWIKHAYVNKFNNIKPTFYSRILDILCKDYYTNAFVTPQLTRRLGLPLLPLSCLFIRASVQVYNMFLATHLPTPLPPSTQTSLSVESAVPSPAMVAALDRLDNLIRNALGRAVYGYPYAEGGATGPENVTGDQAGPAGMGTRLWMHWQFTSDDVIAALTMVVVFLLIFLLLLIVKLLLGMILLRYSRDRYAKMKAKEHAIAVGKAERDSYDAKGKRTGGYGTVEVGDDRRRWIFADDPEGLRKIRERDKRNKDKEEKEKEKDFSGVVRYEMVARRIW